MPLFLGLFSARLCGEAHLWLLRAPDLCRPGGVMAVAFRPGGIVSDQPCALRAMIIMLTWDCAGLSTERNTPVQSACEHRRPGFSGLTVCLPKPGNQQK